MISLTERDKRTIRLAAIAIAVYLVLFFGVRAVRLLEAKHSDYRQLVIDAQNLKRELLPYENRVLLTQKLKENLRLDPRRLARATLVAEASAAIQNAVKDGGIQVGPIRESAARSSARELASMQLEGTGPVAAVMTLLQRLETLGFPLIVDAVQLTPDATKPGMIKINLTLIILDFEQWKKDEAPLA